MISTMPRPRKNAPTPKTPYVDVFSRMDADTVRKLDELAEDQHRSRSGMVAWLVEQYIVSEHPKLEQKRRAK